MNLRRLAVVAALFCIAGSAFAQEKNLRIVLGYPLGASTQ